MRRAAAVLACTAVLLAACGNGSSMPGMDMSMPKQGAASPSHSHGDDAIAHFSVAMNNYMPNEEATVTILIQDRWNKPIDRFDLLHDKQLHLIVVSKDLAYFNHLHPESKGKGRFEIKTAFPSGGDYELFAEFAPQGMGETVQSHWVHIGGLPKHAEPIRPDSSLTKIADGKEVTLSFDHLMAGMGLNMTFSIKDAETKQPAADLQPYLGSMGHAVAVSADAKEFLHVHPADTVKSGADVGFIVSFPKSGIYKIWGQFQQHNEVFTVPFTVKVP